VIEVTLPYPPSLNRLYRHVSGRVLVSRCGRDYKRIIQGILLKTRAVKLTGEISIRLDVFRPQKRGDLDNTLKVLLDSMQGLCYDDDSQIVEINARRFDDKNAPRVEARIAEIRCTDG